MTGSRPILQATGLRVSKGGVLVLDIPTLTIAESEILSLIGPNGAGKTTLLQTLSCLLKLSEGEIFFKGERVASRGETFLYRRKLAMVFQEPLLFDTTVYENVASGLKIRGLEGREIKKRVEENLDRFGISQLRSRSARKISGGEAQRAALARAMVTRPEVLFLDEPFASLDPPSREALITDLERILGETGTATVIATHDRMEALRLSDRVAVMSGGTILQIGPPSEVMNRPVNEFVASFVGVESILNGRVVQQEGGSFTASVQGQEVEAIGQVEVGEPVVLCIRPENVTLSVLAIARPSSSARNLFPGRITRVTPMGLYHRIDLDCGFPLVSYVTGHSLENLSLTEGKEVLASFKATAVHVIRKKGKPEFGS